MSTTSELDEIRLLRPRDAARLLSISVTTLDELVRHGTIRTSAVV
jgi:hypothetical protein